MQIHVREMTSRDREVWADMRSALWPEQPRKEHLHEIDRMLASHKGWGYLAAIIDGAAAGFAEVAIRDYANGCTAEPVPFLEGIWVQPEHRRQGVGAALIQHIAELLASRGYREICSDADIENASSHAAHASWGFAETERVIYFRKSLDPAVG